MNMIERHYYLNQLIEKRDNGRVKVITGILAFLLSQRDETRFSWRRE